MEESRDNDSAHEDEVDEIQAEKLSRMEIMSRMGSQPTWDDVAVPGEEILPELPKPKDKTPEVPKDTLKEDEQIEKQQIDNPETWSQFENKEENLSNQYDHQESYEYNEDCEYDTSYGYNDTTYAYGAGYEYDGSYEYGASYEMNPRRNGQVPNNLNNNECHNPRMPYRAPQHLPHVNYWANNPQHRMMRMPPRFDPHMSIGHPPPLRPPMLPFQGPRSLLTANPVVAGIAATPGANPTSAAQTPQIQNVLNQASIMRQIPNSNQQNLKANAYSTYGMNYHDSLFNAGSSLPAMPSVPGTAQGEAGSFAVDPEPPGSKDKAYSPDDPTLDESISSNAASTAHSTRSDESTSVVCVSDIPTPQMPEEVVKPPELAVAVNSETANVAINPKIHKPVLGKAQAKKRLMAFANKFGVIPKILITKPKPKPDTSGSKGDGSSKSSSSDSNKGKMDKGKSKPKDKVKSLIDELNDAKLKIESAIEAQQQRLGGSSKSKKYEDRVPAIEEIVREESMTKGLLEYHVSPSNNEKGDMNAQGNSNSRGKWKKNRNDHSDEDEESKAESGRKSSERRRRSNDRDRDYKSKDDSETTDRRSVDRDQRRRDRDRNDRDRHDRDGRRRYTSSKDNEKKDGQSPSANNSSRGRDKEREMEKLRNWSDMKKARLSIGETTSSRQKDRLTKNRTAQDFTKHFDQMLMNGDYHLKRYPLIVEGHDGPKQFHPESVKATKRGRGPPILYSENPEISLMLNRQQIYNAVTSERRDKMRQICEATEIQIIALDELEIKKSGDWFKKMNDWKSILELDSATPVDVVGSNSKWGSDSGVVSHAQDFEIAIESSDVGQQEIIQRTEKNIDQINSTELIFDTQIDANARVTNESRLQSGDQILVEELQEKVTAPIYEPEPDPEPTELNQRCSTDVSPIDKSVGDQKLVSEYEQFMKMVSNDPATVTISSPGVDSISRFSRFEDSPLKNLTTKGSLEFGKTDEVVLNDEIENSFVVSVNLSDKNKSGPSNDCSGSKQASSENEIEDGTSREESENSQLVPSDWENVKIKEERLSDESFEIQNKKEKRKKKSSSPDSLESSSSSSSSSASSSSSPSSSSSSSSFSSSTSSSSSSSSSSDSSSKTRRKNRKKKKRKSKPTKRKNKKKAVSSSSESDSSENESSDFSSEEERKRKNKRKKLRKKGKKVIVKRKRKRRKSPASWTSSDSEKSEKKKSKRQIGEKSIREKHADDQSSESDDSMSEGLTVESKKLAKDKSHNEKQDSSSAAKIVLPMREVKEEKMDVEPKQASKKSSSDDKQISESRNYAEVWDYEEESSRQKNDESRQIARSSLGVDPSSQSITKEDKKKEEQRNEKFLEAWKEEGLKISQQVMQKAEAEKNDPHFRKSRIEAEKLLDLSNKGKTGAKHVKEDRLIEEWERENERSMQQIPPDEESSKESSGRRPKRKGKRSSSEWEDCDFQLSTNLHSPAFAPLEKTNKKKMLLMDEWEVDSLEGAKEADLCRKKMKNEKMTEKEVKYDKETDTYIAVQRDAARDHRKKKSRPSAIRIWEEEEEEGEKEAMMLVQERSKRHKNRKSDSWISLDTENLKVVTNDSWENEISEDALWKERERNSTEKRMNEEPDNQCFKNYYDDNLNSDHKEKTSASRQEKVRSNALIGDWAPKDDESSSNKSSSNNTEKSSDSASCMQDEVARKVENGKAGKKKGRKSWELRSNEKTSDWEELDEKEKRKTGNENSSQDIASLWKTEQLSYNSRERVQDLAPKPVDNLMGIDESSWKGKERREPKKNRRSRWDVEDSFSQYKDKKNESDNLLLIEWEEEHNEWVKNSTTVLENFSVKSAAYDDSLARSTSTHHDAQFESKRVSEIPRKSEKSAVPFTSFESIENSGTLEIDSAAKKSWSIDDASASSHNSLSSMIELNFKTKRITPVADKECANMVPKLKCQHKSDLSKPSHESKSRADVYMPDSPVFSQKSEEMDISSESQVEPSKDSISISNIPLPSDELSVASVHQPADIPISVTPVCHSSVPYIVVKPQLRVETLRDESKETSTSRDSPKVDYDVTRPVMKKRVCKWDVEEVPVKKPHVQVEEPPSNVALETSFERKPSKLDIFADYESDSESEDIARSESSENFRNDRGSGVIHDEVKSPLKLIPKQILTHASTTKHVSESNASEIAQGTISFKIPKKILQNHALQGSDETEDAEFENQTAVNVSLIENSERKSGNRPVIPKEVDGVMERDKHDMEAEKIAISECLLPCPVETTEKEMKTDDSGVRDDDGYADIVHKREDDRLSRHSRSRSRSRDRRRKSPEKRERDRWSRDDRRRSRGSESRDKTGKHERSSEVQDSRSQSSSKYADKRRSSPSKGRGSSGKRNRSRSPTSNKRLADRSRSRSPASRRDRDRSPRRRFCESDAERDRNAKSSERLDYRDAKDSMREDDASAKDSKRGMKSPVRYPSATSGEDKRFANVDSKADKTRERGRYRNSMDREREKSYDPMEIFREKSLEMERNRKRLHAEDENRKMRRKGDDDTDVQNEGNQYDKSNEDYDLGLEGRRGRREDSYDRERDGGQTRVSTASGAKYRSRERSIESGGNRDRGRGWDRESPSSEKRQSRSSYSRSRSPPPRHASRTWSDRYRSTRRSRSKSRSPDRSSWSAERLHRSRSSTRSPSENRMTGRRIETIVQTVTTVTGITGARRDSAITEAEMVAGNDCVSHDSTQRYPNNGEINDDEYYYYSGGNLTYPPRIEEAQPRSATIGSGSPKRLSLDDRLELELGIKKKQQQISLAVQDSQPLGYHPAAFSTNMATYPVPPPTLIPGIPPVAYPAATPSQTPKVLQVGNVLQVIPSEFTAVSPPQRELPAASNSSHVVRVGNVLQVVPTTMDWTAAPPIADPVSGIYQRPTPAAPSTPVGVPPPSPALSLVCAASTTPPVVLPRPEVAPVIQPVYNYDAILDERKRQREERKMAREERRKEKELKKIDKMKRRADRLMQKNLTLRQQEGATFQHQHNPLPGDPPSTGMEDEDIMEAVSLETENIEDDKQNQISQQKQETEETAGGPDEESVKEKPELVPLPPPPAKGILISPGFGRFTANGEPKYHFGANESDDEGRRTRDDNPHGNQLPCDDSVENLVKVLIDESTTEDISEADPRRRRRNPRRRDRKSVQFADGVRPGEGTSPSGGEGDMPSPPPPVTVALLPLRPSNVINQDVLPGSEQKIKLKKTKKRPHKSKPPKTKKKVKVKIIKLKKSRPTISASLPIDDPEEGYERSPPPPPPGSPPPPHLWPSYLAAYNAATRTPSSPLAIVEESPTVPAPPPPTPLPLLVPPPPLNYTIQPCNKT